MESPTIIDSYEALESLAAMLAGLSEIAVDTESNSFHNYHERICLLQISTPDLDYIIDPLAIPDLLPLKEVFARPLPQKIFHAAENDVVLLKRHFGFEILNVFDTLLAAQILGHREVGLAALLSNLFSIQLDKGEQRSDWSRRPLSHTQIIYAACDTRHLIRLRDTLQRELQKEARTSAAEEEFQRLAEKEPVERQPDPAAYLRIKGARKLSPESRGILQKLFAWREDTARSLDRPPFRILSNEALLELTRRRPISWEGVGRIRGVTAKTISRFGNDILDAIRQGREEGEKPPPKSNHGNRNRREEWTDEMEARYRRLKEWRNRRAEGLSVEPFIVASNRILVNLARLAPNSIETLTKIPGMSQWRVTDYGKEMLETLQRS